MKAPVSLLLAALTLFAAPLLLQAQPAAPGSVPTAPELAQQGTEALVANEPETAIRLLEDFVKRYQNSPLLYSIYLQLGYAYLMTEQYDKALENARKADIVSAAPELQELSAALVPELLSAKAGLAKNDADRKKLLAEAITAYAKFLERFPNGADVETALFGKGIAEMQSEKYVDAIATLDEFILAYQNSEYLLDARFYAGLARLAEANNRVIAGLETTQRAEIEAMLDQAKTFFEVIAKNENDVALANDAQMQLGDVIAVRARAAATPEERAPLLDEAIAAYQSVEATEPLIALQEARIEAFRAQLPNVARDGRLLRRLQRLLARENQKLEGLKEKKNVILMAKTKIAELFFQISQLDEARVMFRYLLPFASTPEEKKTALYHIALTYALQKERAKAVEAYITFMNEFKGDESADNLPLVVGSLFLEIEPIDPNRALEFFEESLQMYPKGRFAALSTVQKASALKMLGRREEAAAAFNTYLQAGAEGVAAAQAELGIANIDREEGRIDQALARYEKIRQQFPTTPEAEESSFWIGAISLATGKTAEALAELQKFRTDYPDSVLNHEVISRIGDAQRALGENEAALVSYQEVTEKFPDTEPAPVAYLKQAAIYQGLKQPEKVDEVLIAFAERYPDNDNVYIAFKTRADQRVADGDLDAASEILDTFIAKYPDGNRTDIALIDVARLRLRQADGVGSYISMGEEDRAKWRNYIDLSREAAETLVLNFPTSPHAASALPMLVDHQRRLADAGIQDKAAIETYFNDLIAANAENKIAVNKLTFTLASILFPIDPAKALEKMQAVYDPELIYSARDLDLFGIALLNEKKVAEAKQVYQKIQMDFPSRGADPKAESRDIQEAQAIALFGLGKVAELEQDNATMEKNFDEILALYPWSDKAAEAKLYVAKGLVAKKEYDPARKLLGEVFKSMTTPPEVRAEAMFLTAEIFEEENRPADAADTYMKVALFYPSVEDKASLGLFKGGEMLEILATREADPTKKAGLLDRARKAYLDLVEKFPDSKHTSDAKQKSAALQPPSKK